MKRVSEIMADDSMFTLHNDVFKLMRRILHQNGRKPTEVVTVVGQRSKNVATDGHCALFRQMTKHVLERTISIDKIDRGDLRTLSTQLAELAKSNEEVRPAAVELFPDGWGDSMRRGLGEEVFS